MKKTLCLLLSLISFNAMSATAEMPIPPGKANPSILAEKLPNVEQVLSHVDLIRSFDKEGNSYRLTFWESSRVYRVSTGDAEVPCLENSFKAQRPVTFSVDAKSGQITECMMFGGTHPGMRRTSEGVGTGL